MRYLMSAMSLLAAPALAQETREMNAHMHGVSTLELAIDGGAVEMKLSSPGMDIVGFEYAASSDADKEAVETALNTMSMPETVVALPEAAECSLIDAQAQLQSETGHSAEDHEAHMKDDDHEHDRDHDEHKDHTEGAAHSTFEATYAYTCAQPDALTEITFPFFEAFSNAQEIELIAISANGAAEFEVTRDAPLADLSGL